MPRRPAEYPFVNLGSQVRAAREKKKLSQARCAKLSGVSRRHLAHFERGANVTLRVAASILETLDIREFVLAAGNVRGRVPLRVDPAAILANVKRLERITASLSQVIVELRSHAEHGEAARGDVVRGSVPGDVAE